MAKLVFLGRLEDLAGAPELMVRLEGPTALTKVLGRLPSDLAAALTRPKVRTAINGVAVVNGAAMDEDADELAFLPPVSGG